MTAPFLRHLIGLKVTFYPVTPVCQERQRLRPRKMGCQRFLILPALSNQEPSSWPVIQRDAVEQTSSKIRFACGLAFAERKRPLTPMAEGSIPGSVQSCLNGCARLIHALDNGVELQARCAWRTSEFSGESGSYFEDVADKAIIGKREGL